jgi:hypothetical protein
MNLAIGKESIKRAASVNNISKEGKAVNTETQQKPITKQATKKTIAIQSTTAVNMPMETRTKEIVSNIKSDLPIYLL